MTQSTRRRSVPEPPAPRKRPKNRKAQIALVAAEAFSDRGYHAVGVDDIAAALGISGPALYRHFPNKYALLVQAAQSTVGSLRAAAEEAVTATADADAEHRLDAIVRALVTTTTRNRRTGGLYRWEGRYLQPDDRAAMRDDFAALNEQVNRPLRDLRPELAPTDAAVLAASALSVIGSITAHRAALATRRIEKLLRAAAWAVLRADLTRATPAATTLDDPSARGLPVTSTRELLLTEAMRIFNLRGYPESSIEEIGAAAGITASSVYRHFPSKADLLAAAFYRAADRLATATRAALAESAEPAAAVRRLVAAYIDLAFARPEVLTVYFAEIGNLPAAERTDLRNVQRLHIEEWVTLLAAARPDLPAAEARFLVHAALGQTLDIGRLMRFDTGPLARGRMQALMLAVLYS
ncbi:TetR/AcrR family transcriptional regulator [Rhodococcus sp. NPDC054953]